MVSGEAVWFQDRRGFRKGCVAVWLQAGWRFQERLGGFRKGCVVSGKAGVFRKKTGRWFQERFGGVRKWLRERLGGITNSATTLSEVAFHEIYS